MLVQALTRFKDLKTGAYRRAGEQFDVSETRYASINGTAYGTLVERVQSKTGTRRTRKPKE